MQVLYHAVEHLSMHTGQILYITKLRTGRDLGFYRMDEQGGAHPQWVRPSQERRTQKQGTGS